MRRLLTSKPFFILIFVAICFWNVGYFYQFGFGRDFTIQEGERGVSISLNNGRYLELTSINDLVDGSDSIIHRPFPSTSTYQHGSTLQWGPFYSVVSESASSVNRTRNIQITRNNNTVWVKVSVKSDYPNIVGLKYYIQLDYSSVFTYSDKSDELLITDRGCSIKIPKDSYYTYENFANSRSIRIIQQYQNDLTFTFRLNIDCV